MPPPSFPSEVLTTTAVDDVDDVEARDRKETGEEVGFETCNQQECAVPKKKKVG